MVIHVFKNKKEDPWNRIHLLMMWCARASHYLRITLGRRIIPTLWISQGTSKTVVLKSGTLYFRLSCSPRWSPGKQALGISLGKIWVQYMTRPMTRITRRRNYSSPCYWMEMSLILITSIPLFTCSLKSQEPLHMSTHRLMSIQIIPMPTWTIWRVTFSVRVTT